MIPLGQYLPSDTSLHRLDPRVKILSVVVLYARQDSPFIQYHARQGLWLFLISIPLWIIPMVGHLLEFIILAGMIIGFLNAAQGRMHDVPVIGQLAKGTLTLRDLWKKFLEMVVHAFGVLKRGVTPAEKSQAPNSKLQTNSNDQNSKTQTSYDGRREMFGH